MGFSWWHIVILVVVLIALFGRGRISALMSEVAAGIKSLRSSMVDDDNSIAKRQEKKRAGRS